MNDQNANIEILKNVKIVFSINTKRDYFIDWLAEKTILPSNPHLRQVLSKLPNKKFSSGLKMSGILPEETQNIIIDKFKNTKGKVFFRIVTIGENRIEVSAGFTDDAFIMLSEILLMIAKTYHESSEIILDYLEAKLNFTQDKLPINGESVTLTDIAGNVIDSIVVTGSNNTIYVNSPTQDDKKKSDT